MKFRNSVYGVHAVSGLFESNGDVFVVVPEKLQCIFYAQSDALERLNASVMEIQGQTLPLLQCPQKHLFASLERQFFLLAFRDIADNTGRAGTLAVALINP